MSELGFEISEEELENLKKSPPKDPKDDVKKDEPKKEVKKKVKRPVYSETKYAKNPLSKTINEAAAGLINKTELKDYETKLKGKDLQVGQAVVFCMDYYLPFLDQNHPAFVVFSAFLGTLMLVQEIKATEKPKKPVTQDDTASTAEDMQRMRTKK